MLIESFVMDTGIPLLPIDLKKNFAKAISVSPEVTRDMIEVLVDCMSDSNVYGKLSLKLNSSTSKSHINNFEEFDQDVFLAALESAELHHLTPTTPQLSNQAKTTLSL